MSEKSPLHIALRADEIEEEELGVILSQPLSAHVERLKRNPRRIPTIDDQIKRISEDGENSRK